MVLNPVAEERLLAHDERRLEDHLAMRRQCLAKGHRATTMWRVAGRSQYHSSWAARSILLHKPIAPSPAPEAPALS
jgi:hypothetical protein